MLTGSVWHTQRSGFRVRGLVDPGRVSGFWFRRQGSYSRLLYHSTLGERVIKKKKKIHRPWSPVEGKYSVIFQGMLPGSGSIRRGVHFWEVPFALMLYPGWGFGVHVCAKTRMLPFPV